MILVDSSVWIDYFRNVDSPQTNWLDNLLETEYVAAPDIVLTEFLQGFKKDRDFDKALQLMTSLPFIAVMGPEIAIQAARNFRSLRTLGITVRKTIDTLIATRCIEDDHVLLCSDRDFEPFAQHLGLRLYLG